MSHNKKIGQYGEDLACKYLIKKGYKIVDRNVMVSHMEIDIIANNKKEIIFIEVKTRTSNRYGGAVDAMNLQKSKFFRRATSSYVRKNKINPELVKMELVAIDLDISQKTAKIKHYVDLL